MLGAGTAMGEEGASAQDQKRATDPSLRSDPSQALLESMWIDDHASLDAIRERYFHHLGQYRLVAGGYVPDLEPILRWHRDSPEERSARHTPRTPGGRRAPGPEKRPGAEGATHGGGGCFRPGSVRSSVVNVSAAALGAGALALPRAIYYSGIVLGPLLMLLLAVLSIVSIKVIVQLVEASGKDSYEEIAKYAYGPWFALLVEVNIILFCFGTAVAYMITVGQISQQIMQSLTASVGEVWWAALLELLQPNTVLVVVTALILLPLSLLDSINDLRFASLLGLSCILYLILVVAYVFAAHKMSASLLEPGGFDGWQPKGGITGCFKMLSLAIFAFCCQPNVPSIYTELERRSFRRMEMVSVRAMLLCLFVYLLMGVTGFLAFGEDTAGNVLGNLQPFLCESDWIVTSGFVCMAFAVTMAFPLNIFPIRFAVETTLFYHCPQLNTRAVRLGIATGAVACCLAVALALPEINLIFELIGATTGSFVCFIGPGLLLCRLVPGGRLSGPKLNGAMLVVAGSVFLVLGTYSSVLDVIALLREAPKPGPTCPARHVAQPTAPPLNALG